MRREAAVAGLLFSLLVPIARDAGAQAPARSYKSDPVDTAQGDREFRLLWPKGAPGAVGDEPADRPKLTPYLVAADKANGAAVVVFPGGGYRTLASDHEGRKVALRLNEAGIAAFVVQYRVGPRYRHPAPLQDAQRAIRLVRALAAEFRIDPRRVGILGFSAGGHLCSTAGTHFDAGRPDADDPVERHGSRPDWLILGYPVISFTEPFSHKGSREMLLGPDPDPALLRSLSNETQVTKDTPPTFLVHTDEDTGVPPENSVAFYEALRRAGVPAEMHIFTKGAHGLGLGPVDSGLHAWADLCITWMKAMGFLGAR